MHIKNFEAETMSRALLLVKREFGPDAVILSARSVKGGLLKNRRVEVTAATDTPPVQERKNRTPGAVARTAKRRSSDFSAPRPWQAMAAYRLKPASSAAASRHRNRWAAADGQPPSATAFRENQNPALRRHLRQQGIGRELADELFQEMELFDPGDSRRDTRQALASVFAEIGLRCERIRIRQGTTTVAALVGPPGVGKTTTVVKLAALANNRLGADRVGIIAVDNARMGVVEQLLNFATVIGVEARVVRKPIELSRALACFRKKALVLVDTAGVNSGDRRQLLELNNFFRRCRHEVEIHLLLAASTKEEDLLKMAEGFEVLSFSRLLFTRVDESTTHGNLVNIMNRTQTPVSYFSQGQRVPEDLKIATLEKLADLVLGERVPGEETDRDESVALKWMTA